MATGIKHSAVRIIVDYCGTLIQEKEGESNTTKMVNEVFTNLAIAKMRVEKQQLKQACASDGYVNVNRDRGVALQNVNDVFSRIQFEGVTVRSALDF